MSLVKITVIIPTYNEIENIDSMLRAVRSAVPDAELLVVDDNSPDGTGQQAEKTAKEIGRVRVLHRPGKEGLGTAYRDAFKLVLNGDTDVIITMDADFSHDPQTIPLFLRAINNGAEIVVGSRYIKDGMSVNWPLHRLLLSKWGNRYTAFMLKIKVRDCTTGFRGYTARSMRKIEILKTISQGYAFASETLFRASMRGEKQIVEVPIIFHDRKYGKSKMNAKIIRESMLLVTRWGIALRTGIGRKHLPR
ncbi:MAG: polyprenol monophosphomannose synthase [Actinobacteria bacterium]|nr:polyprenol monophosphomannose synthase [Actinomycetota bacterium]